MKTLSPEFRLMLGKYVMQAASVLTSTEKAFAHKDMTLQHKYQYVVVFIASMTYIRTILDAEIDVMESTDMLRAAIVQAHVGIMSVLPEGSQSMEFLYRRCIALLDEEQ